MHTTQYEIPIHAILEQVGCLVIWYKCSLPVRPREKTLLKLLKLEGKCAKMQNFPKKFIMKKAGDFSRFWIIGKKCEQHNVHISSLVILQESSVQTNLGTLKVGVDSPFCNFACTTPVRSNCVPPEKRIVHRGPRIFNAICIFFALTYHEVFCCISPCPSAGPSRAPVFQFFNFGE